MSSRDGSRWAYRPDLLAGRSCHHAIMQRASNDILCKHFVLSASPEFCLTGVAGCHSLHYVHGYQLFAGEEGEGKLTNPTVGGTHPSDLGQYEIADFYVGFLPSVLAASRHNTSTYK
jgi:hypothetical protein